MLFYVWYHTFEFLLLNMYKYTCIQMFASVASYFLIAHDLISKAFKTQKVYSANSYIIWIFEENSFHIQFKVIVFYSLPYIEAKNAIYIIFKRQRESKYFLRFVRKCISQNSEGLLTLQSINSCYYKSAFSGSPVYSLLSGTP